MPEPAFLLLQADYQNLIKQSKEAPAIKPASYIAYYILDMTSAKRRQLDEFSRQTGLPLINCMHDSPHEAQAHESGTAYYRPIEQWLDLISSARYMLTDSFHGSVFAIIFNTEFFCFGNAHRGNSRFDSLFGKLNLSYRLVDPETANLQKLSKTPDWNAVNHILADWRQRGRNYLNKHLFL